MESKLKYLRKSVDLTTRKLEEYVGIPYTTITAIENGRRPFRQWHISKLSAFFNVSSDFLLGKTDDGIIIFPEYGEDPISITFEDYVRLQSHINTNVQILNQPILISNVASKQKGIISFSLKASVYRELKGMPISSAGLPNDNMAKLKSLLDKLTDEELNKIIAFIEQFILKE